ncbi:MAG TPA: hypothetical protein VJX23_11305 [Candidatus Binataceae bacterium]|nr:hypothetical protein [Candidatus Binataceae bacterium]
MADHRHDAESDEQDVEPIRHELERERRRELVEERRVSRAIGFADFMAILMVLATGFSAYATWRTATVTSLVFATADRPFIGVAKVNFEATDSPNPFISVDFRNFGRIPAVDALVSVNARVDGKVAPDPIPAQMDVSETGSIPPDIDHFIYRPLPADSYKSIVGGKSSLQVGIRIIYKGPAAVSEYCNFKRYVYDYRTATFRPAGGSDKCRGTDVF